MQKNKTHDAHNDLVLLRRKITSKISNDFQNKGWHLNDGISFQKDIKEMIFLEMLVKYKI